MRATVWIDTVKRGPMVRDVRGLGTLVVEQYMWIPAEFESRVEKINFLPGATVHPNDVIMVLSNPQMELDATDLEWQIKAAQANLENLRVTLESQQLAQKGYHRTSEVGHGAGATAVRSRFAIDQAGVEVGPRHQAFGREVGRS